MNYRGNLKDKDGNTFYPLAYPRCKGYRNNYYYIGKQNHCVGGGSKVAGQLVLYVSNMDFYDVSVAGFVNIDKLGAISTLLFGNNTLSDYKKVIYVYTDGEYDYVFIYAPNYNDNWYVDVLTAYNFNLAWVRYTANDFQNFIADKTLVSQSS